VNIGLLNTRILIQKNSLIEDDIRNQTLTFEDFFSCAATLGNESGSEKDMAGQTVEEDRVAFTVRYCPETAVITSSEYRVVWNEELYNITSVDHMNLKRKSIKIWCQKVRR
jgi:SPP1 family predicted phage head-tail adaptor